VRLEHFPVSNPYPSGLASFVRRKKIVGKGEEYDTHLHSFQSGNLLDGIYAKEKGGLYASRIERWAENSILCVWILHSNISGEKVE